MIFNIVIMELISDILKSIEHNKLPRGTPIAGELYDLFILYDIIVTVLFIKYNQVLKQ